MQKVLLCALNARYSHTGRAVRSLAAYVEKNSHLALDVAVLELTTNELLLDQLERLYKEDAAVYAFSVYIWNVTRIEEICRELKKIRPDCLIIWGGPEASVRPGQILAQLPQVDYIFCGEGEAAFLSFLENLAEGNLPDTVAENIAGLCWRQDGVVRQNNPATLLAGENWPGPPALATLQAERKRLHYYESSRGCPFNCSYCISSLDRTVRYRPLDQVKVHLEHFIQAGVGLVKFVDRTFNCRPARAAQIWQYLLERYAQKPFVTSFHFEIAGDLLDDAAIELLQAAPPGLFQLEIGVQSSNRAVLAAVNRSSDLERLARQVKRLRQTDNIHLHLDLIAGLPGEDLASFSRSFDFIMELKPQLFQLGFLKVLPGTAIWQTARELGYAWQDQAPYEVLASDGLSFADLAFLKKIEKLLDVYANSRAHRAASWLAGHWTRPWDFYRELLLFLDRFQVLERPADPARWLRRLYGFARASGRIWGREKDLLDLLRVDYRLAGHKGLLGWLGFWEQSQAEKDKLLLRQLRQEAARQAGPAKLRFDRIGFDWLEFLKTGELLPADQLLAYASTGGKIVLWGHGPTDQGLPKPGHGP